MTALDAALPLADGDGELDLLGVLPPGVLIALAVIALIAVVLAIVAGGLVIRRVRRGPLAARGRELARSGILTVGSMALPAGRRELAALGAQVNGARDDLARYLREAASAGRYVGGADVLGPPLIAEGDRIVAALRRLSLTADAAPDGAGAAALSGQAEDYLRRVRPLIDSLRGTSSITAESLVTEDEIRDAVAGLRASDDAYRQFMGPRIAAPAREPDQDRPTGRAADRAGGNT